ncbi:MAG: hypothetical protein AB7P18_33245 [Candidatus Binatia bacterium]
MPRAAVSVKADYANHTAEPCLCDVHGSQLVYELMRYNEAPAKRQRISSADHEGAVFWRLRR